MVRLVVRTVALAAAALAVLTAAACPPGATAAAVRPRAGEVVDSGRGLWPQLAGRQDHHEDEHHKCDSTTCVRNWKLVYIAVLFIEGVLGGLVPYGLKYLPRFDIALHMANAFSGGIFIATGMLHVLPEALELMAGVAHDGEEHEDEPPAGGEEHHDEHEEPGFPSVYAFAMASFFVILFVEHLLLRKYASAHGHAALAEVVAEKDVDEFHVPRPAAGHPDGDDAARKDSWDDALGADAAAGAADGGGGADTLDAQVQAQARHLARMSGGSGARLSYGSDESFELRRQTLAASNGRFFSANFFRALLAIVAVALHSMFESLSLGLASDFSSSLSVFIAIAAHKWATSIALGVKCEKEQLRFGQYISLIVLFAAVTPLAAGLGLLIAGVDTTIRGTLFALSAGIFLYIGAFEVPAEEFMVHPRWLWGKYVAYISGAIVITGITAILVVTGVH
ncbi:hypothetical protein I4F81_010190 [Pyropia yezoensis]|uniref:Uncharacterized protein n=1 Tax=Pyropia yezoensis TaxID=2788 RepID=A0ACC3CC57_PYRYE|nr:hypothetical protein I4F81_010190 [Neopyropia yezoensis]